MPSANVLLRRSSFFAEVKLPTFRTSADLSAPRVDKELEGAQAAMSATQVHRRRGGGGALSADADQAIRGSSNIRLLDRIYSSLL